MARKDIRGDTHELDRRRINENFVELYALSEVAQAERVIHELYGDTVSVETKAKNLTKFGRTANADAGVRTTIAQFQGAVVNETFATTNSVDSIISSDAADTMNIVLEGQTIDGSGNMTFVTQTVTLNGQTAVTLGTAMARATRMYPAVGTFASPASIPAGTIYVYDATAATGTTAGVPDVAEASKLLMTTTNGGGQTSKCSTSISSTDYWLVKSAVYTISQAGGGPTAKVEFRLEIRDVANGGVWRPLGSEIALEAGVQDTFQQDFSPYLIVPKNHDFRAIALSSFANTEVAADVQGVLAAVV